MSIIPDTLKTIDPFLKELLEKSLKGQIGQAEALNVLTDPSLELFDLLGVAFLVRRQFWNKDVLIHILNNVQNGLCSEDCGYCAQSRSSKAKISTYPLKTKKEIMEEAHQAYQKGAFRHCMVFSGRQTSQNHIEFISQIAKELKEKYPMEICVSSGILNEESARALKDAGVDRINHNINTSAHHYPHICTTHFYEDRIRTIKIAKQAGLQVCSGIIIGMGESAHDIIDMAWTLSKLGADSIPVNFLIPIDGISLKTTQNLTPEYCLRVLCLIRFLNPKVDLRIAAGREFHLRDLQVLSLYVANSLFLNGYLNVKGSSRIRTLKMIRDAGFAIKSEFDLNELIQYEQKMQDRDSDFSSCVIKSIDELRPLSK